MSKQQISELNWLKKIPTLFDPQTKSILTTKDEIFGFIGRAGNARNEKPNQDVAMTREQVVGDLTPWSLGQSSSFTDPYISFDNQTAPQQNTRYENWGGGGPSFMAGNITQESKGTSSGEIESRLSAMTAQREKEFAPISRK